MNIRLDAGHIGGRGKTPYDEGTVPVLLECLGECSLIDTTRRIERYSNHIGCGLTPWQLIGVVLVGTDKHQCAGGRFIGGVGLSSVT